MLLLENLQKKKEKSEKTKAITAYRQQQRIRTGKVSQP